MRSLRSRGRTLALALTHPNPDQGATVRTAGRLSLLLHPLHRARPVRQAARDDGLRQRRLADDRAHPLASAAAGTGRRGDAVGSKYPHGQCPISAPCASSARNGVASTHSQASIVGCVEGATKRQAIGQAPSTSPIALPLTLLPGDGLHVRAVLRHHGCRGRA